MARRRERPLLAFALLSIVSLLADMTYEGGRSVLGPLAAGLGAGALLAGLFGAGDLVGYLARAASGLLLDRLRSPRALWLLVFAGYTINLAAVPLLALAGHYWEALALVVLERAGKGLRAPARDVVLAETGRAIGGHRAFAIHELADQAGAVLGPLTVAWVSAERGLRAALLLLAAPAAGSLASLALAYLAYPRPRETRRPRPRAGRPPGLLPAMLGLSIAALPLWPVYTLRNSPGEAAAAYSLAMLADAVAALAAGELAERLGRAPVWVLPALAALAGGSMALWPLHGRALLLGSTLWGAYMGFFEVYSRSAIAEAYPPGERARAYGLLGLYTSLGLAASGLAYGLIARQGLLWAAPLAALLLAAPSLAASTRLGSPRGPRAPSGP